MSVTVRRGGQLHGLEQRDALAAFLLVFMTSTGLATFFRALPDDFPPYVQYAWGLSLVLGGFTGLSGMVWKDPITGLLILRAGLIPTGVGAYLYAVPAWVLYGPYSGIIVIMFGLATHVRAWQITKHMVRRS